MASKVWGWRRYLDVYEKPPAANTPKCSQEKPQPFRQVKLRKSYICSSDILPRETHALKGQRIQPANASAPKHAWLAWPQDYSSAPAAKAGMSTSRDCSRFAICKNAARSHRTQQNHAQQETRAKSFLKSNPRFPRSTACYRTPQGFKVFLTGLCGSTFSPMGSRQPRADVSAAASLPEQLPTQ